MHVDGQWPVDWWMSKTRQDCFWQTNKGFCWTRRWFLVISRVLPLISLYLLMITICSSMCSRNDHIISSAMHKHIVSARYLICMIISLICVCAKYEGYFLHMFSCLGRWLHYVAPNVEGVIFRSCNTCAVHIPIANASSLVLWDHLLDYIVLYKNEALYGSI
jgi:hypothetical protein